MFQTMKIGRVISSRLDMPKALASSISSILNQGLSTLAGTQILVALLLTAEVDNKAKALTEEYARYSCSKRKTERNRLAYYLDDDVRRWSTGKEGNLRALLSTLLLSSATLTTTNILHKWSMMYEDVS